MDLRSTRITRCGGRIAHLQHEGVEVVRHLQACASPDLPDAGAGCLELGLGALEDQDDHLETVVDGVPACSLPGAARTKAQHALPPVG